MATYYWTVSSELSLLGSELSLLDSEKLVSVYYNVSHAECCPSDQAHFLPFQFSGLCGDFLVKW